MKVTAEIDGRVILTQKMVRVTEIGPGDYILHEGKLYLCHGRQISHMTVVHPPDGSDPFTHRYTFSDDLELRFVIKSTEILANIPSLEVIEASLE